MTEQPEDWTARDGTSNSSIEYLDLCVVIEQLIRGDAHRLLGGRADHTARLILSTLAHRHGLAPKHPEERVTWLYQQGFPEPDGQITWIDVDTDGGYGSVVSYATEEEARATSPWLSGPDPKSRLIRRHTVDVVLEGTPS